VSEEPPSDRERAPGAGWELGAAGLGKASWAVLAGLLLVLGVGLLIGGYVGYGGMIVILAAAAAVNLF
jgi:hypothetical protein